MAKMKLTYFAVADGSTPVEVDEELARDLYRAACIKLDDDPTRDLTEDQKKADAIFETGKKVYPHSIDKSSYIYGTSLTEKERFKMVLRDGIQTTEEFRESRKRFV